MSDNGGRSCPPAQPASPAIEKLGGYAVAGGNDAPIEPTDAPSTQETPAPVAASTPEDEVEAAAEGESESSAGNQKAPKKWFELMPVVLDKVRKRGKEMPTQFGRPPCVKCSGDDATDSTRDAELKCLTEGCEAYGVPTCAACFIKAHALLSSPGHQIQDLSKCPLCQLERVGYWCCNCELDFCDSCFSGIHSVRKVRSHRRFAIEGSSGKNIAKSNWSSHFHANVMQVLAVLKRPYSSDANKPAPSASPMDGAASADSVDIPALHGKRKREADPAEMITIDSDNDSDPPGTQASTTGFKRMGRTSHVNSIPRPLSAPQLRATASMTSTTGITIAQSVAHQLQPVEPIRYATAAAASKFQVAQVPTSSASPMVARPLSEALPFPQELMIEEPDAFANVSRPEPIPYHSTSQQGTPTNAYYNVSSSMGIPSRGFNSTPVQTIDVNSTPRWTTPSPATTPPAPAVSHPSPTEASMPGSAGNGAMASYSMMSGAPAISTGNPLLEAMIARYNAQNHAVYELECRIQQLNEEIVHAAARGPYAAAQLMAELNNTQATLRSALDRRDRLFVMAIVQSPGIIRKVRQIRLTEVMDVPQVPPLSHRKCLQLSYNINGHKSTLQSLNNQLATAISSSGMANASAVNATIQQLSASIAAHEQSMQQLVEDRQSEFVRVVQFSEAVREALKMEFRRYQQQQMQQHPHQPQAPPYRVP